MSARASPLLLVLLVAALYMTTASTATTTRIIPSVCNSTVELGEKEAASGLSVEFPYAANLSECTLSVHTLADYGLRVDFEFISLMDAKCANETCCDYVQVGAGDFNATSSSSSTSSRPKHCSSSPLPESAVFGSDRVWISMHTDATLPKPYAVAFRVRLTMVKLVFRERKGTIQSPVVFGTANGYPNNLDLVYKIAPHLAAAAAAGHLIYLRFQETFGIESANGTCIDYLEIGGGGGGDASSQSADDKLRLCGKEKPEPMYADAEQLYARFVSDESIVDVGFSLYYSLVQTLFTAPRGTIVLDRHQLNIAYTIRAPEHHHIELTVDAFHFPGCNVRDTQLLVSAPAAACHQGGNDYVKFSNERGAQDQAHFEAIMRMQHDATSAADNDNSEWIFCACHRPVRTYVSLTNELTIGYFVGEASLVANAGSSRPHQHQHANSFHIAYKFVRAEHTQASSVRLVQDQHTSLINGYDTRVRVPAGNHLRLYGKSAKVGSHSNSYLTIDHEFSFHENKRLNIQIAGQIANRLSSLVLKYRVETKIHTVVS